MAVLEEDLEKIRCRDEKMELARWAGRRGGYRYDPNTYRWEEKYNVKFSVPIDVAELEWAWKAGMLRREELKDGEYYWGVARNCRVARWSAERACFEHMRLKGAWRLDKIPYPSDERVVEFAPGKLTACDVFIPWVLTEPLPFERVTGF